MQKERRLLANARAVQGVIVLELPALVQQTLLIAWHAPLARLDPRLHILNQVAWLNFQRKCLACFTVNSIGEIMSVCVRKSLGRLA